MRDDGSILPVSMVFFFSLLFSFPFFTFSFLTPVFFPSPPYPLPLPTPEYFFPTSNLNLWIFHRSLPESTWFITNQSLKIMTVVPVVEGGGGGGGGGGGVALVPFNSRRPV